MDLFKREYTPWSFLLPGAIAVAVGVLLADGIKLVIAALGLSLALGAMRDGVATTTPGHLPARPDAVQADSPRERWYAPRIARQLGQSRACDQGTVLEWRDGAWEPVPGSCVTRTH